MSSPSYTGPSSPTTIFSFPTEIIEQVLVACALYGFPEAIASLSATCRLYRDLIYDATDNHLWREIFLAVFDDPRPALKFLKEPLSVDEMLEADLGNTAFDWQKEFQSRIQAQQVFKQNLSWKDNKALDPKIVEQSLNAILSTIGTTTPTLPNNSHYSSLNIPWLQQLFAHGFPDALLSRLTSQSPPQSSGEEDDLSLFQQLILRPDWERTEAGKAFYKLFFLSGFRGIPRNRENEGTAGSESRSDTSADSPTRYNLRSSVVKRRDSEARQRSLARTVARHRVYRLPYLTEDRCWGPFMPMSSATTSSVGNGVDVHDPDEDTVARDDNEEELVMEKKEKEGGDKKGKGKQRALEDEVVEEEDKGNAAGTSTTRTTRSKAKSKTEKGKNKASNEDTPVSTATPSSSSRDIAVIDSPTSDDVSLSFIRAILSNFDVYFDQQHQIVVGMDGDEDEDEDGEYVPPEHNYQHHHAHAHDHHDDDDDVSDNDDTRSTHSLSSVQSASSSVDDHDPLTLFAPASGPLPVYPPQPHLLMPDYTFLSAARLVVAENLKERYGNGRHGDEPMWPWFTSAKAVRATGDVLERMGMAVRGGREGGGESGESGDLGYNTRVGDGGWECLRTGSAPGFWKGRGAVGRWGQSVVAGEGESEGEEQGKGEVNTPEVDIPWKKEEGLEYVDGWDWAGAEGKWMRAVCWMDYRDLLFHNLQTTYSRLMNYHQEIQETCRVFPMTLRIVAYSRVPMPPGLPPPPPSPSSSSSGPSSVQTKIDKGKTKAKDPSIETKPPPVSIPYDPLVYALPVIHIVGEFRGSDVDEHVARRARGTVRMIGDRAIRWNLISSEINTPDRDEWVMEGVQVGGVGSSMGVVGMWTGANHERGDPIGPSWAWKVE